MPKQYIKSGGKWVEVTESGTGGTPNAVQYVPQALTGDQQTQARKNIDAQSQVYAVKRANPWSAEDCVNAPVRGLKLYGACEQKNYRGVNLIKLNGRENYSTNGTPSSVFTLNDNMIISGISSSGYFSVSTTVIDEITDNSIKFHTTTAPNSAGYGIGIVLPYINTQLVFSAKYNMSCNLNMLFYDDQNKYITYKNITNGVPFTPNIEGATLMVLDISANEVNSTRIVSDLQLEKGTTPTQYEPYVGGMPSPSPDYPQEVKCNDLTYTLKNDAEYNGGSVTAPSLYGIGDAQDEWDAMTGHGVRRIKKITFNGTENWKYESDSGCYYCAVLYEANVKKAFSNYFLYTTDNVVQDKMFRFGYISKEYSNVLFRYNYIENTNDFSSYVSQLYNNGEPLEIYIILNYRESFETTPEGQITMPDGYAQFLPSGDGAAGDIEAEYAVDIEKRYVPKETYTALEERVSALESAAIGG